VSKARTYDKNIYPITQPLRLIPLLSAPMGVEGGGMGSGSGWQETTKTSEVKKSMDPDVFR
jgi:hypothetical protein